MAIRMALWEYQPGHTLTSKLALGHDTKYCFCCSFGTFNVLPVMADFYKLTITIFMLKSVKI